MRFSLRSKAGGLFLLLALIALISGFAVSGSLFRAPFTRASGVNAGVTKGQLTPVAVVNPTSLTFTPDTPGTNLPKGARHLQAKFRASPQRPLSPRLPACFRISMA